MGYFRTQIPDVDQNDIFIITIHCDLNVFEWLLKYIRNPEKYGKRISKNNVISLMVSGDYLKI